MAISSAPALYGRITESTRIGELLDDVRVGHSGTLVMSGEAGVGKSAPLDDARERAGGIWVLGCRGIESEAELPFAALHQLVRPALGHAEALPRVQQRALCGALGLEPDPRPESFLVS